MAFSDWDEIRTAFHVARLGTVSAAAQALGVHHATVIRHIDSLESHLGAKLFQRHPRGYTPTEAGQDLLTVAQATDDQLNQLASRIKGQGDALTGDLNITSLGVLAPLLLPAIAAFQNENPDIRVNFLTDERLFRLEYGEAHVAIRAGKADDQPDNVVQPFYAQQIAMFASPEYVDAHGRLESLNAVGAHRFIGSTDQASRAPFMRWLLSNVPSDNISFRVNQLTSVRPAIRAGVGIGFSGVIVEETCGELIQMYAPEPEWASPLSLVTHVDLHRTPKVQSLLSFLKAWAKDWPQK